MVKTLDSFDVAVLIGRFQPFHQAHAALLSLALEKAPRVLVVLGSAFHARNARNPFTWEERREMIGTTLDEAQRARVSFVPLRDYFDDRRWSEAVLSAVKSRIAPTDRVALVGVAKDASTEYLRRFPAWDWVSGTLDENIDALSLRRLYFESEDPLATQALLAGQVPAQVAHFLQGWALLPPYSRLREEHVSIEESKKVWGAGPFITVDAVVTAADHVLLIKRGNFPGKGQWALPGGFLDSRERVLQGAIRELREETELALLDSSLENSLKATAVFDHPDRSSRGRTITHAHHFELGRARLPEVRGSDDAADARWVPITELAAMEDQFFEDHFIMLDHFLSLAT